MSEYRKLWMKAIRANQRMLADRQGGLAAFDELIAANPIDGMVLFERGEANEHLGFLEDAERDYLAAESLLTSPHWKTVARLSRQRVERARVSGRRVQRVSCGQQQWDVFHRLHGLSRVPDEVRRRAIPAIARVDSEPESAAVDLRWCVEFVIGELEKRFPKSNARMELGHRIDDLLAGRHVSETLARQMHVVREGGGRGAHPARQAGQPSWVTEVAAFVEVIEWANNNIWH